MIVHDIETSSQEGRKVYRALKAISLTFESLQWKLLSEWAWLVDIYPAGGCDFNKTTPAQAKPTQASWAEHQQY